MPRDEAHARHSEEKLVVPAGIISALGNNVANQPSGIAQLCTAGFALDQGTNSLRMREEM
jgi:hypothetical protein